MSCVVLACLWPTIFAVTVVGTPLISILVMNRVRRSWMRIFGSPSWASNASNDRKRLQAPTGVPFAVVKTSLSQGLGPRFQFARCRARAPGGWRRWDDDDEWTWL